MQASTNMNPKAPCVIFKGDFCRPTEVRLIEKEGTLKFGVFPYEVPARLGQSPATEIFSFEVTKSSEKPPSVEIKLRYEGFNIDSLHKVETNPRLKQFAEFDDGASPVDFDYKGIAKEALILLVGALKKMKKADQDMEGKANSELNKISLSSKLFDENLLHSSVAKNYAISNNISTHIKRINGVLEVLQYALKNIESDESDKKAKPSLFSRVIDILRI